METNNNKTKLKSTVLDRIQQEKINPRSRCYFNCYEFFVWVFWVFSVLVGSLAIAVSLFAINYQRYAFYEATHGDFVTFIAETLPYIWFFILVLMVTFAIFNIRHTKKGYKHPLWKILSSSLLLSLIGGVALHIAGMGFAVDQKLGKYIDVYQSQEEMEQSMWQKPEEGRLVGMVLGSFSTTEDSDAHITFKDSTGIQWKTNIEDLFEDDLTVLRSGKKMKMLGEVLSTEPPQFHACGVFPWMFEKNMSIKELSTERRSVIDRIYKHKDHGSSDELKAIVNRCAELKVMRHLEMM
jgi:hypothetical protein